MKEIIFKKFGLLAIGLSYVIFSGLVYGSGDFAPPVISLVDKYGVNLADGQISQSLNTVSIGGSMGISHNIAAYTNEFSMTGFRGYQDKFYAITRKKLIGQTVQGYGFLEVLNVHDYENSVDFIVKLNGQRLDSSTSATSGYTYEALRDDRHTLAMASDGYLSWTKPNGVVVRFMRSPGAKPFDTAVMESITYPNNFTIKVESPYSVVTNTGFKLKYIFVDDNRSDSSSSSVSNIPLPPTNLNSRHVADCAHTATWSASIGATFYIFRASSINSSAIQITSLSQNVVCTPGDPNSNKPMWVQACNTSGCSSQIYFSGMAPDPGWKGTNVPPANPLLWSQRNPKYIQAVNSAFENCAVDNVLCNLKWPKVTFEWPVGMPRSMYQGESTLKVTDAMGGVTEFRFKSFDLAYDAGVPVEGKTPGERFSPRLVGVKPATSSQIEYKYTYKNLFYPVSADNSSWFQLAQDAGVITSATRVGNGTGYYIDDAYYGDVKNGAATKAGGIYSVTLRKQWPGTLIDVVGIQGSAHYEQGFRNFMESFNPLDGLAEVYTYTRGNLTKITYADNAFTEAEYPPLCNQTNYKYCNKPTWTSDRKGNKTYFEYHRQSGEVQRVTSPPNKINRSAVTRYSYEEKQASFFQNGVKSLGTPIWLKTAEKTCIQTATSGDACVGGAADEVVTSYEYNNDNLLLSGMTVRAFNYGGVSETKRTCYQYDIYGNRIGETQPNANLTSCSP